MNCSCISHVQSILSSLANSRSLVIRLAVAADPMLLYKASLQRNDSYQKSVCYWMVICFIITI